LRNSLLLTFIVVMSLLWSSSHRTRGVRVFVLFRYLYISYPPFYLASTKTLETKT